MRSSSTLFAVNPALDRHRLRVSYDRDRRVQIRDVLTPEAADAIADVLEEGTRWGLAWGADGENGANIRAEAWQGLSKPDRAALVQRVTETAEQGRFAFLYGQYPMLDAYLQGWDREHPLDRILEHINDAPFLNLVREVTGHEELLKADAQATLFAPGQFLAAHDDSQSAEGRRVAYVLGFARDWQPDWGGYLLFYDAEDDVVSGFKPRFNVLNLFEVPQRHNVTYVPPFAPYRRFAITGWFRDR